LAIAAGILLLIIVLFLLAYNSGKTTWTLDQTIQYMVGTIVVLGVVAGSIAIYLNRTDGPTGDFTEYAGVALGDTMEDIRFKKGVGQESTGSDGRAVWVYDKDYRLVIFFDDSEHAFLVVAERSGKTAALPKLGPVNWTMTVTELQRELGEADNVVVLDRGLSRRYEYPDKNLFVGFTQGQVDSIGLRNFSVTDAAPR